ncbi:hypothetical protein HID58_026472, partial [Brassica napus]
IEQHYVAQGLSIVGYFHTNKRFGKVELSGVANNIGQGNLANDTEKLISSSQQEVSILSHSQYWVRSCCKEQLWRAHAKEHPLISKDYEQPYFDSADWAL